MKVLQLFRDPVRAYTVFAIIYIALVALLPANKNAMAMYDLSPSQYHVLLFFVVLPYVAVWLAALYGYGKLQNYARLIEGTPEGEHYQKLASGVRWLAYGLPITAILSILLNSIANEFNGFYASAIIINNYLSLIIPLIGIVIIGIAARSLAAQTNVKHSFTNSRLLILGFMVLGVLYCYFTFRHFELDSLGSTANPYFLPIWLMLISLVIPFLYTWFIGLFAAYELIMHSRQSQGILYKQALTFLGYGLAVVIASFIALQYLNTAIPRTGSLTLNYILILAYAVRFVMAAGFILIAMGANKLKRIEEV